MKSLVFILFITKSLCSTSEDGVKYANKCEGLQYMLLYSCIIVKQFLVIKSQDIIYYLFVILLVCKILAVELEGRLQETGKTSEYLEIGYSVDLPKKKKEYKKS